MQKSVKMRRRMKQKSVGKRRMRQKSVVRKRMQQKSVECL